MKPDVAPHEVKGGSARPVTVVHADRDAAHDAGAVSGQAEIGVLDLPGPGTRLGQE